MPKNILIVGASRGLGLGLAKQFSSAGWQVIATVRDPQRAEALNGLPQLRIETLDMDDAASVDELAARLAGTPIDVLFVNAGIAGRRTNRPPKPARRKSASCSSPTPSLRCAWPNDCCHW